MKQILLFLFISISISSYSQVEDAWVYFTNKPNASTQLQTPINFLTQRALDRRTAQGISITENDVPIHQPYIDQIIASTGILVKAKSKWLNCLHIRGSVIDINALLNLTFVDHIIFADNSLNLKTIKPKIITAINKNMDVEVNFNYGSSDNQIQMLNGHLLHQANFTGSGKIIAVLDSGFINVNVAQPFARLFENNLILGGYNYVSQNTNVYSLHNHGTLTLSCMGGFVDGQLVGTAPDAKYYLFVTEDVTEENPVEESYWVEAAEEADRLGADVISTSLGYFGYDNTNYSHTYELLLGDQAFASRGANIAFSKGMVVVASAGNAGTTFEPHVGVPAEANNVLAVGAVKADETYATFSSIGPGYLDRVKPDVMAKGQSSTVSNIDGNIVTASGTSFSCPIMAGMIASLWQAIPWATNQQVVNFVKQSADRFSNANEQYGYGIPDFQLALNNALSLNQNNNESFLIYPNPVNDYVYFTFPNDFEQSNFKIFNALGQTVLNSNINKTTMSISIQNLNSGVYFYQIQNNLFSKSGRIIKN